LNDHSTIVANHGCNRRTQVQVRAAGRLISQHGHRAGWAYNITADPRVKVKVNGHWRTGTAAFVPDDDVRARARSFASGKIARAATAAAIRALESDPITVRITFD
jgi:hypothetical protein